MSTIGICIPCGDTVDSEFCRDYSTALAYHAAVYDDAINQHFRMGTLIAEQRVELCKVALENGADWVIFLDSDMTFPKDIISRLIEHDVPVVAANCSKRRRPVGPTARKENEDDKSRLDPVWPDRGKTGLEQIHVIGTAVMAIKAEVLFQIPHPWFAQPWLHDEQRFVGEDLFFCGLLKGAGIPLYLDHDLSWDIGHIGKYEYRMRDVLAEHEFADAGLWEHIRPEAVEV